MNAHTKNNFNFSDSRFSPTPESRKNASKPLVLLCSLNFVIAILGYSLTMALLSPLGVDLDISSGENRLFTWPYRFLALLISGATLFSVRNKPIAKIDWRTFFFIIFYILYILRTFYDLELRDPSTFSSLAYSANKPYLRLWVYTSIFFGTIIPILGIIKSIDLIDFRQCLNWIFYIGGIALLCSLFSVQKVANASWTGEIAGRTNASAMLGTIWFGHLGLSIALVAFYKFLSKSSKLITKTVAILVLLLGVYVMLRAGSRGPILCLFIVTFFFALSRSRYAALGLFLAGIFATGIYIFTSQIIELIKIFSPALSNRLAVTIYEGDTSGRDVLIADCWSAICDSPLSGVHLDLLGYSHNACIDGFLMFGFLFGWIILLLVIIGYRAYYLVLKNKLNHWWVALLGIQSLTACQTSGTFGANSFVQCLWIVCVIWTTHACFTDRGFKPDLRHNFGAKR